jgi:AcrR family transcriptional regulator
VAAGHASPSDLDAATRALRAQLRTRQLLAAAAALMERDGFHSVSMQALADEAGVSVGLIYRYFDNKQDVLLAVIVDVLDDIAAQLPLAIGAAGPDPVEQLAAAFAAYCRVIDRHRHAAVLTYRESKTLSATGRKRIKALEVATSEPLRAAIEAGVVAGRLRPLDVDLFGYDLVLLAHGWALKHWYFERTLSFDRYVSGQLAIALGAVIEPRHRPRYRHLLEPAIAVAT